MILRLDDVNEQKGSSKDSSSAFRLQKICNIQIVHVRKKICFLIARKIRKQFLLHQGCSLLEVSLILTSK